MAGQAVKAVPDPVQQAGGDQARQDDPWRVDDVQIADAQQPFWLARSRMRWVWVSTGMFRFIY
jgi:hypothetical protein